MKTPSDKLVLSQETVRNLTAKETNIQLATHHTCVKSVCGLACTPAVVK